MEEKIRYLANKFPHTEWSGVLFTTHQGTFEKGDLVITCQDLYPMDLGNATYTEFNMSEDVAAYMADNIELFDCELQLIHSHHSMSTTPSGTDLHTLREEGNERNCFVSLIVNNAGTYYAAVTRKLETKDKVIIKSMGESYEFFGEGRKEIDKEGLSEVVNVKTKEFIEYFDLEVERHEVDENALPDLKYLDGRFDEILSKKKNRYKSNITKDDYLWDIMLPIEEESRKGTNGWQPDKKKIHRAAVNIVTCNLIINPNKFDFKQWITRHLTNVYKRIFNEQPDNLFHSAFDDWCNFIIPFVLDNFDFSDATDEIADDIELLQSRVAKAIYDELLEYGSNYYIRAYCDSLEQYIVE